MVIGLGEKLDEIKEGILTYDGELTKTKVKKALKEGVDPIVIVDAMTEAIRDVGDGFGKGELWLTELVGAAEAMSSAMPLLEVEIKKRGVKRKTLGTVVIGTVLGDIHNIGKMMVATLLTAEGFEVFDLGVDVRSEKFVEAVKKFKADILCLSALMTTTASEQQKVIETLRREGLREGVRIMVGGGAITKEFAADIGADGYDPTAPGAAKLARELMEGK